MNARFAVGDRVVCRDLNRQPNLYMIAHLSGRHGTVTDVSDWSKVATYRISWDGDPYDAQANSVSEIWLEPEHVEVPPTDIHELEAWLNE